jgi:hypothetical protein
VVAPPTEAGRLFPGVGPIDVLIPKRPGSALHGTLSVNTATACTRVVENAVAVRELGKTLLPPRTADKPILEKALRQTDRPGDFSDFLFGDPDKSGFSGTASTTLQTTET